MYVAIDDSGVVCDQVSLNGNIVMYSSCKAIDAKLAFNNFSIKYVSEGDEIYSLKNQEFVVKSNQYLLCNSSCEGSVLIDSKTHVKGICIDISNEIISEVLATHLAPDTNIADLSLDTFFHSENFLEWQFDCRFTCLGQHLKRLEHIIMRDPYHGYTFEHEFYYNLSENIISDYIPLIKQFRNIRCVKNETKKDLLRRLTKGKEFLEQHYCEELDIEKVANESNISQYHFFRLFRSVYGVSPYQYLKQLRLNKAKELLQKNKLPLAQLAIEIGYCDIYSFSKAYKQMFGHSPTVTV